MHHHFDTLRFLAAAHVSELRQQARIDGLVGRGWTISKLWKRIRPNQPRSESAPKPIIKPVPQEGMPEIAPAGD